MTYSKAITTLYDKLCNLRSFSGVAAEGADTPQPDSTASNVEKKLYRDNALRPVINLLNDNVKLVALSFNNHSGNRGVDILHLEVAGALSKCFQPIDDVGESTY